jgi:hypothetical protein
VGPKFWISWAPCICTAIKTTILSFLFSLKLVSFPGFVFQQHNCTSTYFFYGLITRITMTIDKTQNLRQHRQQPLLRSDVTLPLCNADLGCLPARSSMPNSSRRDNPIEQRAFLRSILEQAIEILNDVDCNDTDGEKENSRSQNQNQ